MSNDIGRLLPTLALLLLAVPAGAQSSFLDDIENTGMRFAESKKNFEGVVQESVFFDFRTPWSWSSQANAKIAILMSLDAGRTHDHVTRRSFVSLGPTLRLLRSGWTVPVFMDVGLSPTYIDGTTFGTEDLGSSFNFTSHIGFGVMLGPSKRHELKVRYQHISNGGIENVNPGMDMLGIDYAYRLGGD